MKAKLKLGLLPPNYIWDSYSQLQNLIQGRLNFEEYPREFEKLLIKCDIQEPEEQTIIGHLGCLEPTCADVVDL